MEISEIQYDPCEVQFMYSIDKDIWMWSIYYYLQIHYDPCEVQYYDYPIGKDIMDDLETAIDGDIL